MANKKRGLGRGLDALLSGAASQGAQDDVVQAGERLADVPVDQIKRGRYQPRSHFDEDALAELADSIRAQGIVQPVVIREVTEGGYELIAGERRWRAAQLAGLHDIPAVIRDVSDEAAVAMALIENIQREDLNPLEEALALQRLISEFELTHQEAAEAVGRSRTAVTNLLRLLQLNAELKQFVENGQLEMGHARALLALQGRQQSEIGREVVAKKLNVRQTEALVRSVLEPAQTVTEPAVDPNVRNLQRDLSDKLAAPVVIKHDSKGRGTLVIRYNSLDELDGIIEHIK